MKSIGIDIGTYSIKVAEVHSSGSQASIKNFYEYPLSQSPGTDKELDLITTLKEVVSLYSGPEFNFSIGISQAHSSVRKLFFPFKEKFKILKSLPFELEDLTPIGAMDGIFDGKVVYFFPNGAEVLAAAVPKTHIEKILDLSSDVGIDPHIVSLEGFALNNLFEDIFIAPETKTVPEDFDVELDDDEIEEKEKSLITPLKNLKDGEAVIDIGHSSSVLIVRSENALHSIRHINWGMNNLIKAVAKEHNILEKEALAKIRASKGFLLNKAHGNAEQWKFSELLSNEIQSFGQILKLSLLEIKGTHSINILGIGLLGGASSLKNIGAKITQATSIASNKIVRLKNYPEIDLQQNSNKESSMGVAIGLALELLKRPSNPPINFRRGEFKKENAALKHLWQQWGFYVNLTAASIAVFFVYSMLRAGMSERLAYEARSNMRRAAEAVFKMKQYNASESKLNTIFNSLDKREQTKKRILELTSEKPSPLVALKKISEKASSRIALPIDIEDLKINSDTVEIKGTTTAQAELKRFADKLKSLAKGQVIKTEQNQGNKTSFKITFKPKDPL